jgi:two-component system C4-dicarboxylate transport sensor histidine kinase DctB
MNIVAKKTETQRVSRWYLPSLAGLALILVALLALVAVDGTMRNSAMNETTRSAEADVAILAAGLESELEKFSLVPRVLADDPEVRALLKGDRGRQNVLNRRLEGLAAQTGAAALYLIDANGMTLAASNWQLPASFVGSNYGFRTYFTQALATGGASEFALGTVSRRPGLYIADRVGSAAAPLGAVVVKVEFDAIEASWRAIEQGVFVTDEDGVVLIASNPDWRFRSTDRNPTATRKKSGDALRFGRTRLDPMPELAQNMKLVATPLLKRAQPDATPGWRVHLIVDAAPRMQAAVANGRLAVLLGLILAGTAIGALMLWIRRRETRAEAIAAERTSMLRDQLQQANRLATLGQVTAGVGHEIRQPVAAVRVFAENGERLIATGDITGAAQNFEKIVALTARIGQITEELLGFGRRAAHPPKEMPLAQAIDGALLLLKERIARQGLALIRPDPVLAQTKVRGEHVRLEQVLINLLQNAIDASPRGGTITIEVAVGTRDCRLSVTDSGPGIDPAVADTLFQPFATTKAAGIGLGLAISLDIMRALGGDLVNEASAAGARFTMVIPRA